MAARELNTTRLLSNASLKAYYRFENGALTTDSSGNSHTLTAISDPAATAGVFGGGVSLDSNDGYSSVSHTDFKPTGNFTIGGWFTTTVSGANGVIFSSWINSGSKYYGIMLQTGSTGLIAVYSAKGTGTAAGTDYATAVSTSTINDGNWHFVVGTWDGSYLRLYVDGKMEGLTSWANAPAYVATMNVRVGCRRDTTSDINFITGSLDDIFLFNGVALSSHNIYELYSGGRVYNPGMEYYPSYTAETNTSARWVDGAAAGSTTNDRYGYKTTISGTASARFDTTYKKSGASSLKLQTGNTGSYIVCAGAANHLYADIQPSSKYLFYNWIKTNVTSGDSDSGAQYVLYTADSSYATIATRGSGYVKTTIDWTRKTVRITSESNGVFLFFQPRVYGHTGAATLIMQAWYDDLSLRKSDIYSKNGVQNIDISTNNGVANASTKTNNSLVFYDAE